MFRSEASANKRKLHGDVFFTQPTSYLVISLVLVLIVILALTITFTGTYARSERVSGYLVPSNGIVRIQASQFGTLDQRHVVEGDVVIKGQRLVDVSVSHIASDGQTFAQKNLNAFAHQKVVLETQIAFEKNQLEAELAKLTSEREELELKRISLRKQIALQKRITLSAEAAYKDVQGILEKGYISKIESERRYQMWLSHQSQEQLKSHELTEATARLNQLSIRVDQLPIEAKQRIGRIEQQLSELDTRIVDEEVKQAYTVRAPISGKVVSINSGSVGRTIEAGQALLSILPENSILEAELFVPSRAAGFIEVGMEVRLLYDAFPYQRFGSYQAVITQVTETILAPSELMIPLDIKEPVYRVKAELASDDILIKDKAIKLQNGMTLQANIILERQSFLEWLLSPLVTVSSRSS